MLTKIGFAGMSGVGKTTAATHLGKMYGFRCMKLAQPLENFIVDLDLQYELSKDARRSIKQQVGSVVRSIILNAFVDRLLLAMERIERFEPAVRWVVDDVRFPNEAECLREHGFCIVRIIRENNPYALPPELAGHESELFTGSLDADFEIHNDGGPGFLEKLDYLMASK